MDLSFRKFLFGAAATLGLLSWGPALAQQFPAKPVRLILASAPGGLNDSISRALANELTAIWGQPVVMEYKPGASGAVAVSALANNPADGYTILGTSNAISLSQNKSIKFDVEKDLKPVLVPFSFPVVIFARPTLPVKSLSELVAYMKANAGLKFAANDYGSVQHVSMEMLNRELNAKAIYVPYKGGTPATMAAVAGEIDIVATTVQPGLGLAQQGKLRTLGILSAKRASLLPDVQAMGETGVGSALASTAVGYYVLAGTPPAILASLNAALGKATQAVKLQETARQLAIEVDAPKGVEATSREFIEQIHNWGNLLSKTGIQPGQ